MQIEISELVCDYRHQRIRSLSRRRTLAASILEHGQQSPALVVRRGEDFVLIDGYARVAALTELARDVIDVVVLEISEVDALVLRHRLRTTRRAPLEDAWLIQDLLERHALSQREVGIRLERSEGWVSRCLALVRVLPKAAQDAVKLGIIPAQAAKKYLVPLARAKSAHCTLLVTNLGDNPISVRQLERLYLAWRRGDDTQRKRIVDNPCLFLRAAAELDQVPAEQQPAERIRDGLEGIAGLCRRTRRRLGDGEANGASNELQAAVLGAWKQASLAYDALASQLAKERRDGRLRDQSSNSGAS